jgi:hypothetical protein
LKHLLFYPDLNTVVYIYISQNLVNHEEWLSGSKIFKSADMTRQSRFRVCFASLSSLLRNRIVPSANLDILLSLLFCSFMFISLHVLFTGQGSPAIAPGQVCYLLSPLWVLG